MRSYIERTKSFLNKHERRISVFALLAGFVFDSLTLTQIDRLYDNMVIIAYIVIASIGIFIVNLYSNGRIVGRLFSLIDSMFPILIQFAFGGLFSAFTVFYSRSATLSGSWPFLLVLVGLLIGNEFLKKHYRLFTLQIGLLFFVVYSYLIFVVPILLQKMGTIVFLTSGVLAYIILRYYLKLFSKFVPELYSKAKFWINLSVVSILVVVNTLYFLNYIPPIPLSLKHIGVYHSIVRGSSGDFVVRYEEKPWYKKFFFTDVYKKEGDGRVYVLSNIYAPVDLTADIIHEWQKYDDVTGEWKKVFEISFPVRGGRSQGYRGYSYKENPDIGLWRVNVKTAKGQIVGRQKFRVEQSTGNINIVQKVM